jgi:hypothetical protein
MSLVTADSALHVEETTLFRVEPTNGAEIGGIGPRPIRTAAAVIRSPLVRLSLKLATTYAARVDHCVPFAQPAEVSGPTPEAV